MTFNPFAAADAAAPVSPKKAAKKEDKLVFTVEGVLPYSATCAAEKSIKALKGAQEGPLKDKILDIAITVAIQHKKKPDSFKVVEITADGNAEATATLTNKGSNVALTDEEAELLDAHNIPYDVADEVVDTYIFNPEHIKDPEIMKKVAAALSTVEGLPADIIQKQSAKKRIVTAKTVDSVCALVDRKGKANPSIIKALLQVVTTVSLRPKINGSEESALKIVETLVGKKAD